MSEAKAEAVEPHPEQYERETADDGTIQEMYETERDRKTEDAEAAAAWHAAAEAAPTEEQATTLRKQLAEIEAARDKAAEEFARAAVERACVLGFQRVAAEQGVTPKQLHAWRKRYLPDLPDLSAIPDREMRREERRVKALDARIEAEKLLREQRKEHAARLARLQELTGK